MTTPETPEQDQYIVRLLMRVDVRKGSPPEGSVSKFVELLVENGLRDWVYRVENLDGSVIGYYDGYGDEVDIDNLKKVETPPVETVDLPPAEETDESLLALASSLNEGEQPSSEA